MWDQTSFLAAPPNAELAAVNVVLVAEASAGDISKPPTTDQLPTDSAPGVLATTATVFFPHKVASVISAVILKGPSENKLFRKIGLIYAITGGLSYLIPI